MIDSIFDKKHLIKRYLTIALLVINVFLSTRLLLKAGYGIELTILSEKTLFLICTSLWLVWVFSIAFKVVLGRFPQQPWYFPSLIVFAKWPVDWLHHKLLLLDIAENNMWLSLYHPVMWTGVIYCVFSFGGFRISKDSNILE